MGLEWIVGGALAAVMTPVDVVIVAGLPSVFRILSLLWLFEVVQKVRSVIGTATFVFLLLDMFLNNYYLFNDFFIAAALTLAAEASKNDAANDHADSRNNRDHHLCFDSGHHQRLCASASGIHVLGILIRVVGIHLLLRWVPCKFTSWNRVGIVDWLSSVAAAYDHCSWMPWLCAGIYNSWLYDWLDRLDWLDWLGYYWSYRDMLWYRDNRLDRNRLNRNRLHRMRCQWSPGIAIGAWCTISHI